MWLMPSATAYYALGQALGGEVIRIAAGSPDHINAMDMVEGYGDGGNPVVDKSEFIVRLRPCAAGLEGAVCAAITSRSTG